jgi:ParB family chromosome partitioning protein
MQKKGLGKGLSALLPSAQDFEGEDSDQLRVSVDRIYPSSLQPRRAFDDAKLEELASSIREKGIIQPLLVRKQADRYELIAGERRLRAAMKAKLDEVPVIVRDVSDTEALQLALVENLQREDLNPIEEANAYRRLHEEFSLSQEQIADKVGKSRPAIANSIRLLQLPNEVQRELAEGKLTAGQARALLALEREALILAAMRQVIMKSLSTRETERLVQRLRLGRKRRREPLSSDPDFQALIEGLQRWLGTKVRLTHRAKTGKGKVEIEYYSAKDLERIVEKILPAQPAQGSA